jgi:hypothetical protein
MLASEERVALVVRERSGELQAHSMSRALSTETSGRRWPSWCSARANWVMPASRSARSWTWLDATSATNSPHSESLRRGSGSSRTSPRAARCSIGTGSSSPAMATSKTVLSRAALFPKTL